MGFGETVVLGAIAGSTIYMGLPLGRIGRVDARTRVALAMFSVGILAFIFMDVSGHAQAIIGQALGDVRHHRRSLGHVLWLFVLLGTGFSLGVAGISVVQRVLGHGRPLPPVAGGEAGAVISEQELARLEHIARRATLRTGMTIATAIGLHNFAEGLAIGVSAGTGAIGLAPVLVVGFALHNATEGFGIVGTLGNMRP